MMMQEKNLLVLLIIRIQTVIMFYIYQISLLVRNLGISCLNKMLLNNPQIIT